MNNKIFDALFKVTPITIFIAYIELWTFCTYYYGYYIVSSIFSLDDIQSLVNQDLRLKLKEEAEFDCLIVTDNLFQNAAAAYRVA